jgi:hypothetical protein
MLLLKITVFKFIQSITAFASICVMLSGIIIVFMFALDENALLRISTTGAVTGSPAKVVGIEDGIVTTVSVPL